VFKSLRVPCFMSGFSGHGDDPESKELKFVFYVMGIQPELAREIAQGQVADRLFRKNEKDEWEPARETTKATFGGITIPMQNITFYALSFDDRPDESGVLVEGCAISNLRASRPYIEARFEFDVVVPMDRTTMKLVEKFYKATCFLTMEEIQRTLEVAVDQASVEVSVSLQDAADDTDGKSAGAGEGRKRGKRNRQPDLAEVTG
jgi:hypothetical protein